MSGDDQSALVEHLLANHQVAYRGAAEYRSCCPFEPDSDNPSVFRVREVNQTYWYFSCFSCGEHGSMQRLVERLLGLSGADARSYLADAPRRRLGPLAALPKQRPAIVPAAPVTALSEAVIASYKRNCPVSLLDRGFSRSILQAYEVGYAFAVAKAVFPLRDHAQRLIGLTYRTDYDMPEEEKYWHDFDNKSHYLYGLHRYAGKPVRDFRLVEGQLDPVRLAQLEQPAAALMGCLISDAQIALLRHVPAERYVLALDNDDAGKKGIRQAIPRMVARGLGKKLYVDVFPTGVKDPGELTTMTGVHTVSWLEWVQDDERQHGRNGRTGRSPGASGAQLAKQWRR